jgi:predicted protein tyrosine phosphatase
MTFEYIGSVRQIMFPPLFVIQGPWRGRLAIAPAPAPGPHLKENLSHWQKLGLTTVLSLMSPGERPGWEKEETTCRALGLKFHSIPIPDHSVPKPEELPVIAARLKEIEAQLRAGEKIVAHCFAGIGRSAMATIGLLVIAGTPLDEATKLVSSARGLPTPETEEQLEWLRAIDRHRRLSYT